MKKITPKRYIQGFCIVVVALGVLRAVCPQVAYDAQTLKQDSVKSVATAKPVSHAASKPVRHAVAPKVSLPDKPGKPDAIHLTANPHRIYSVASFKDAFPDENDVQTAVAVKKGVKPVADRAEAEKRKGELVYIGSNPYFYVDKAKNSIPYLVPRASVLVQDIGKNFFDSLRVKGIPLHKIIVTSAMRTKEDVEKLQKKNHNAISNSAHCYGTTVDIAYNRYKTVQDPEGKKLRLVRDDTLKWVLSEVLNDMRKNNRCYIKYEVKQGCFHLTVR